MKAVRLMASGKPLVDQTIDTPSIGPNDLLVRVQAAGICHSDVYYRSGFSRLAGFPLTPGHEVSGIVEKVGGDVTTHSVGERVCLHYLVGCGTCEDCRNGNERFCADMTMIGKERDGGFAEFIAIPAKNAVQLPNEISFTHGAVMMCSSATSLHALQKGRLAPGETVAIFGAGGLGLSAVQLAFALGAGQVVAVDINEERLALAASYGAIPVHVRTADPVSTIREHTNGRGVDVSLELVGSGQTAGQSVACLAPLGRAVIVGLSRELLSVDPYGELIGREAEIIGSSDHLVSDLPFLIDLVRKGTFDLSKIITGTIPLAAGPVNAVLDRMENFGTGARTVILPQE